MTTETNKSLFYITTYYYDKSRPTGGANQDGYHRMGPHYCSIMTESEAMQKALEKLKLAADADPTFGGMIDGNKTSHIVRIRKVEKYTDTVIS